MGSRKSGRQPEEARHQLRDGSTCLWRPAGVDEQDRVEGGEYRWQTVGPVDGRVLLIVAHTGHEDEGGEVIRILSARRASPGERRRYEQENR